MMPACGCRVGSIGSLARRGLVIWVALSACFLGAALGQSASEPPTLDSIDAKIAALEADGAVEDRAREEAIALLQSARQALVAKGERASRLAAAQELAGGAEGVLADIATEQAAAREPLDLPLDDASAHELQSALALFDAERMSLRASLTELRDRQAELEGRVATIADDVAAARDELSAMADAPPAEAAASDSRLAEARALLADAYRAEREAAIGDFQAELATLPGRQSITAARLALTESRIDQIDAAIETLRSRLSETELGRAEAFIVQAEAGLERVAGAHPMLEELAAENLELVEVLHAGALRKPELSRSILEAQRRAQALAHSTDTVERVLAAGRLTEETGALLRSVRRTIPDTETLGTALFDTERDRVALQLKQVVWQDQLRGLADLEAASVRLLESDPAVLPADLESGSETLPVAVSLLAFRRDVLASLISSAQVEADQLAEREIAHGEVLRQAGDLSEVLDRRLLWLRSDDRFNRSWIAQLPGSIAWVLSPPAWWGAGRELFVQAARHPAVALVLVIAVSLLLAMRGAVLRSLPGLAQRVGHVGRDTYWTTPLAVAGCVVLSLPWLIGLGGASWLLFQASPDTPLFVRGLARTLETGAVILPILILCRHMSRPNSLFRGHFGWNDAAGSQLHRHLGWFILLQVVAIGVFELTAGREALDQHIGLSIAAFSVASVGLAVFSFHLFKPRGGIVSNLLGSSAAPLLLTIICPLATLEPLVFAALAYLGFFETAVALQFKVLQSAAMLLLATLVYGLSVRMFLVGNRRFALRQARELRAATEAARSSAAEAAASGEPVPPAVETRAGDAEQISGQVRSVLWTLACGVYLVGIWLVWSPILPALGIADDIVLWRRTAGGEGTEVTGAVTLWDLILSGLLLFAGWFAARNVRGLLEAGLFEQLDMDRGARYATVAIVQYLLIATALVLGLAQLGVDWSRLQWIIAALGVGLGFGLQEIVANFFSGLIILFERPIRVGDVVSIGGLSGTVTDIRIRATTITDFNSRQVILPNKTIITENVTNWTRDDAVTRLLLKVGVAYGSDVEAVRERILETVSQHADVLDKPSPSVYFMRYGDSALIFEIRVFVGATSKRLRVTHELNTAINKALAEAGIEIPFPQTDVRVRLDEEARPALEEGRLTQLRGPR